MQIANVAAIVGAALGLGAAAAEMLARGGAKVTVLDCNADLGSAKAAGIGSHFVALDVSDVTSSLFFHSD